MTEEQESDRQLLVAAARMSGLSERQFAMQRLGINERTYRRYKAESTIPAPMMNLVRMIHRNLMKTGIRRDRQGVPPATQRRLLAEARAKRERRGRR